MNPYQYHAIVISCETGAAQPQKEERTCQEAVKEQKSTSSTSTIDPILVGSAILGVVLVVLLIVKLTKKK